MNIKIFHHKPSGTLTYLVIDSSGKDCVLIDPPLDFENNTIRSEFVDGVLDYINSRKLHLNWVLDTHLHADHLTGAFYLNSHLNVKTGISIVYKDLLHLKLNNDDQEQKEQYTAYLKDGDILKAGKLSIKVIETPGHTKTCLSYVIEDCIFCGDLLLMPQVGCGRCDFDGGDPEKLFESGNKILSYPDHYKTYVGHNAQFDDDENVPTVKEQRETNVFFSLTDKELFIQKRNKRDQSLTLPRLFHTAIKYNFTGSV